MEKLSDNQITTFLLEKEIRPTHQRIEIMKYLNHHKVHPTADMIFLELKDSIPTFSKTTVYNTLKLFQEKGVLSALATDEDQVRYEANLTPHGHFKCIHCGEIFDIDIPDAFPQQKSLEGHRILEYQIMIKGICAHCQRQAN